MIVLVPTDQPLKSLGMALVPFLEPTMSEVDRLAEADKLAEHIVWFAPFVPKGGLVKMTS
jgi:hypothetical protein